MAKTRDDFSPGVKAVLASRAGYRCSKPDCRALTVGPSDEHDAARTNIGVAAHITAASPDGPRYDPSLTSEQRRSATNGIWTCQNHGKEVDDDVVRYTADTLRAWKHHAEVEARALLGRPISAQSVDVSVQVAVHRAPDNTLVVTGTTNLPSGAKLWVEFYETQGRKLLGQAETRVVDGMFAASGFMLGDRPYPHGWYAVDVLAYFNGPWRQSDAVLAIVGKEGQYLVGRFAEPLHPEFEESEKRLRASFSVIVPLHAAAPPRSADDLNRAMTLVREAVLTVDDRVSADPIDGVVKLFMKSPDLRPFEEWTAEALSNGAIVVSYSFWNGSTPERAEWIAILDTREVRYRNLYGKYMSWSPDY